ncbi:ABC-F family ATP-binding cassette domain-containing protein [Sulfurospirillum arcachonense]|uniref:ABC-F family ATP-binding cassette domain-containing protein n=1 Tax=Sulfurospirillum arcachonense TaxID=57666 RepID=UPI000469ECAD|nr:ATP-binding cassette domain-containing protein [Sulfurospirillum arcachonense]
MLEVNNLSMRFSSQLLFEDINLKLDVGKRYGLIGANGAGKSTFMKILSGELEQTSGNISIQSGLKVGTLSQNQYAYEDFTLKDAVMYGNKRLYDAIKEKEDLYVNGDFEDEKVNDRLSELEIICSEEDPTYEVDVNIEKILCALDFPVEVHNDLMSSLTGGDKFKILLAQVLYPKPDILFLDEPTNNLDLEAISWLEEQLKKHEGTMVVISHDRHFLNSVCTNILDVDFRKIREFTGNYDDWYIAANLITKQQELEQGKKLKEKEELEAFVRRFSANASKAKQATSRQKRLEKLDIEDLQVSTRRDPSIIFKAKRDIGNEVLEVINVNKSYDEEVLKDFSFKVEKDDKIALIGANGVGKTTLLNIIMGELKPESGEVKWGATIEPSYFPQNTTEIIDGDDLLFAWLQQYDANKDLDEIRKCLGRMLFTGEDQKKSVKSLSGGEKHRMMLSKMMLQKGNFLALDEPDNHLDLEAIIALGEGLFKFPGNVICVTHDRELIDAFANRIIEFKADGSIIDFKGDYEKYKEEHGA